MPQYKKINVLEGIDTNKTSGSKECMRCTLKMLDLNLNHMFVINVTMY